MKRIIAIGFAMLTLMTGCGKNQNQGSDPIIDESKLPDILFVNKTSYHDVLSDDDIENGAPVCSMGFYDKDGNYYSSTNEDVYMMDDVTLINEFESGNLDDKVTLIGNCDKHELQQQAVALHCAYLDGELENAELDEPMAFPSVESEHSTWLGIYYNAEGNLQRQTLHANKHMTQIYMTNDALNEIYEWLRTAFNSSE